MRVVCGFALAAWWYDYTLYVTDSMLTDHLEEEEEAEDKEEGVVVAENPEG